MVVLQEIERYNSLLKFAHTSLSDLAKAMQGLVTITPLLDLVIAAFLNFAVRTPPPIFYTCIHSHVFTHALSAQFTPSL